MAEELSPGLADTVRALGGERGPCPAADALLEYHALAPATRVAHPIDAHVQICSRCQLVLMHLDEPPAARRVFRWQWAAAAALLLLAAGPAVYRIVRPAERADTIRGSELQPISPVGDVAAVTTFTWQTPAAGLRYNVTVYRRSERVWAASPMGGETSIDVSRAPNLRLEPGVEYRWIVEGVDASGDVRIKSPMQTFRITGGR
jgi:hypothetical protein